MGRPRTKKLPTGIHARKYASGRERYWIDFRDQHGERVQELGGDTVEEAKRLLAQRREAVAEGTFERGLGSGEQTLATYAVRWVAYRRTTDVRTVDREEQLLRDYVLPMMGALKLAEIRPRHVSRLVSHLGTGDLAPKSIRNVHGVLSALLTRARFEELVIDNAAKGLPRGELPKPKRKRNVSAWTRGELERWVTPGKGVPEEFTVAYAIASFTGARVGEIAGMRWRDLDTEARPLWRWALRAQYDGAPLKTDNPRDIPIHPELQRILATWKLEAWPRLKCRHPGPDDLVVPRCRPAPSKRPQHIASEMHSCNSLGAKAVRRYATKLGIDDTGRDFHSFRRGMITVARTDGAPKDVIERITHNAAGEMIDGYTYFGWETLCEAMAKVRLAPLRGVVARRRITASGGDTRGDTRGGEEEIAPETRGEMVEAAGIEPHGVGGRVGIVGNSGPSSGTERGPESPTIPAKRASVSSVVTRVTAAPEGDPLVLALEQARRDHIASALRAVWEDDGDE